MSRRRRIIVLSATMATAGGAAACGDGGTEPPTPPPDPLRPTTVTVTPATADLTALGETVQLRAEVRDQNGQAMAVTSVSWASDATAVATVNASGLVTAAGNGTATITATAGASSGTAAVTVSVGSRVTLDNGEESAPEGGVVTLGLTVDPVPDSAISVRYTLGVDGDESTSDADGSDYTDGGGGAVEIAAGAGSAVIEIAINDDDEIEPLREVFTLTLDAPASNAGYRLGVVAGTAVTIEEGVCDRASQVATEIVEQAGVGDCVEVEDLHLASIHGLGLCFRKEAWLDGCREDGDPITDLREGDFLGLSGLEWLNLDGNSLAALPQGLFSGLSNLREITLGYNELLELPEGAFSGLRNLRHIGLSGNRLAELAAGIFTDLSNLRELYLSGNQLAALPEEVFSSLSSLVWLDLNHNNLTSLPEGLFSDLTRLEGLGLDTNDLTALPPGVFSGLTSLRELQLGYNPGSPFTLTVELTRTDGGDPTSRGPATLGFGVHEGAPFAMNIPLTVRGGTLSPSNAAFAAGATIGREVALTPDGSGGGISVAFGPVPTVCEDDPESSTDGPKCSGLRIVAGDGLVVANPETVALSVPAVHLTQASQDLSGRVPLIAGRDALLRVFATADERYAVGHEGRATFFVRGREVHSAPLQPPASGIPIDLDEGRLAHSFNARIPGHVLQPGLEMAVELDPDRVLPLKEGGESRFPASGRLALDVRELPPLDLTVVPILYLSEANRGNNPVIVDATRDMAGPDTYGTVGDLRDVLPIGDLNVRLREPYYTWADTTKSGYGLLREIAMLRHLEAVGDEYYHGIFFYPPGSGWGFAGLASQPGYQAISSIGDLPDSFFKAVFAHEFGHNLSLWHARCDVPPSHPAYTSDPDGSIGEWGHRFIDGDGTGFGELLDPDVYTDLMGEDNCPWRMHIPWISDRNFIRAFEHRLDLASTRARVARAPRETLLLWGGVQEGNLRLEPAFAHDARLKLPEAPGPYRIEGVDQEGRHLFSFSFTPDALSHGGGTTFLFAVPFEPDWAEDLDRITLAGPEGSTTLDRDTGGRGALILDRSSGRVRTIARDWRVGDAAAIAADSQVKVVRGLPRG